MYKFPGTRYFYHPSVVLWHHSQEFPLCGAAQSIHEAWFPAVMHLARTESDYDQLEREASFGPFSPRHETLLIASPCTTWSQKQLLTTSWVTSQAAWHRMENGPKSKNGKKIGQKIENGPRPKMGEKWPKEWPENGIWGHFSIFSPILGHFFPISGWGPFLFFGQFFPIFGFRLVFHSIPGSLTRNSWDKRLCTTLKVDERVTPTHNACTTFSIF